MTITIQDCQQLALDNNWDLPRTNACHIANQNAEMGDIRVQIQDINFTLVSVKQKVDLLFWFNGIIAVAVIGTIISLIFKKVFYK